MNKPPFDPTQPYQAVDEAKPPFDPTQPYEDASSSFNKNLSGDVPQAGAVIDPKKAPSAIYNALPTKAEIPELVGSMAGGFAHTTLPGVALSAAGAMAGEGVRQAFFEDAPMTGKERFMKLLGAGARGAVGEAGGRAIGKAFAPFSGNVTPEIASQVAAAESVGIKPPLATMTSNPAVAAMERASEFSPFTGNRVTRLKEKALQDLSSFTESVGNRIGEAKDAVLSGNLIKESAIGFKNKFDETKNKLYDAVLPQIRDLEVDVSPIIDKLKSIAARHSGPAETPGIGQIEKWANELTPKSSIPEIPGMAPTAPDVPTLTFAKLKEFRTRVGARGVFNDPALSGLKSDINGVYGAISDVMDNAVSKHSPELGESLNQANQFFQQGQSNLKSKVYNAITKSNPENIYKAIFLKNSPTNIEIGKEVLGDDFKYVARQWFDDIVKASTNQEGVLSPVKLAKKIQDYDSVIQAAFSDNPELLGNLSKLKDISSMFLRNRNVTQGSQTAYNLSTLGSLFATIQALILNPKVGAGMAAGIAGASAGAAGIASDFGREYLTRGFPNAGSAAAAIASPAIDLTEQKIRTLFKRKNK